ncbi:hypothetical protein [Mesorhizobium sp.]|uniref:hypothetical protein n=1 Tax=Mesorhizobium sp. TaxID=1871066 RepID=UPI00338F93D8
MAGVCPVAHASGKSRGFVKQETCDSCSPPLPTTPVTPPSRRCGLLGLNEAAGAAFGARDLHDALLI